MSYDPRTTAGSPASPAISIAKGVALPFVRREAVRSGAHEMAYPDLDLRPVAVGRGVPARLPGGAEATRWSTSGAATSCGACVGELRDVPGAILEVGVWRGGTGALMAARAAGLGIEDRVYLCDTWKGVVKTGDVDIYYRDGKHDDTSQRDRRAPRRAAGARPNVELLQGIFPDDTGDQIADQHVPPRATSTSTSTSRPRTSSTGSGRGCRPAASSSSTTTASRPARASPSSSTSSACATTASSSTTSTAMASSSSADAARRGPASYGQHREPTPVDRFGVWLSAASRPPPRRELRRQARRRLRLRLRRDVRPHASSTTSSTPCSSTSRSPPISRPIPKVDARSRARCPTRSPTCRTASLDVVLCLSVLEHLWEPQRRPRELRRVLAPGGVVPAQRAVVAGQAVPRARRRSGSGSAPPRRWTTTRRYYDPRDLWPMLVQAGFRPQRDPLPPPQVRPEHVRRVPGAPRAEPHELHRDATSPRPREILARARRRRDRGRGRRPRRGARRAAAGCSSSASAARPATPATPSTTSASCAGSRPTRRPTTCPS